MSYKTAKELVSLFEQKRLAKYSVQYEDLLTSMSPSVRIQAVQGLMKLEINSKKVDHLLVDPNPSVRKSVVKYFKENGLTEDYQQLLPLLKDPDEKVIEEVIQTIFWLSSEYDIKPFLDNHSPKIRYVTLKTLEDEIEDERLEQLIDDLNPKVQGLAWTIKTNRSNDPNFLKRVINDSDDFKLRRTAIKKLLPYDAAFCFGKINEYINDTMQFSEKERCSLLGLIKELPIDEAEKIINHQVEEVQNPVLLIKLIVPYVSLNTESPAKVIQMLESFSKSESALMRVQVLKGFSKLNETSTVPTIRSFYNDPDDKVRAACVAAMTKMLDYHLVELIDGLMNDYSKQVRKASIKAIGRLKMEDAYPYVISSIQNHLEDDAVRKEAMMIASRLKLVDAAEVLEKIILNEYEDHDITINAARALLRISPEKVIEILG
ncbi:MAG TPA: HEAT repeat domain-containing protein [Thermotogota bacterium]|nr:HEAT repeat domain-containing protein [Thermotogota bacterium]HRW33750.1 HEAT repeat domain-containing protein [Thermotogota bacterium]